MSYERGSIRWMTGYVYGEQPVDLPPAAPAEAGLPPAAPATAGPRLVKLNTNENPYPPSPAVAEALAGIDVATLRRYPPARADALRRQFAAGVGVDMEQVVVTNGGDEALRLALTTFVDPGSTLGLTDPTYSLLAVLATVQGCRAFAMPLEPNWRPPADFAVQLNAGHAKLTCIINPHAPSGALLPAADVAALAESLDGVLLVDEAYVDFVDPAHNHDLAPLVHKHDNLLLLRTLSKGYSLAGLRVGFLIGDAGLIAPILHKTRDSYNVDAIAQTLAAAALADGAHTDSNCRKVRAERGRMAACLEGLGFSVPESEANFLLARVPQGACAETLHKQLRENGVLVRHFDAPRLHDCLRITVGTQAENDRLTAALAHAQT